MAQAVSDMAYAVPDGMLLSMPQAPESVAVRRQASALSLPLRHPFFSLPPRSAFNSAISALRPQAQRRLRAPATNLD